MEEILGAIFFGIFVYAILILLLSSGDKQAMNIRFKKYLKGSNIEDVQDQVFKEKQVKAKKRKSNIFMGRKLTEYLLMSGVRLNAKEFLLLWTVALLVPTLLVYLVSGNVLTSLAIGMVGFAAPPFFVHRSRVKRQEKFNVQLGEALTVMGNCIKAGFSFQQAMESLATEMQPPISTEFSRALREIHYGVSMQDALNHMVTRVNNKDLDLLVSAVLTSAQVGGNLSDILEVISETIRDRIKIKAEVRVLTTSGRSSGLIIGLLPVFIILVLMVINPAYFSSFAESSVGKLMLAVSVALEVAGFAVINKIVSIKY